MYKSKPDTRSPGASRRGFLQAAGSSAAALAAGWAGLESRGAVAWQRAVVGKKPVARPRPDLLAKDSPPGIEVFQLTTEADVPSSHLYMEAQVFTTDSKRFVLHRSATAHGGIRGGVMEAMDDADDPKHQYLLCDLDDNGALLPLTNELGVTAASVSPDDRYLYYFVNETEPGGGRLTLKRVNLDATDRQTILVIDGPLPGTNFRASRPYFLSTISSDGKRLAIRAFLGDGKTESPPFGLLVFELLKPAVSLVLHGPTWSNMHSQYCRSRHSEESHDILIQENHGCVTAADGRRKQRSGGEGADIHVIRDDGSDLRNMPWGRDGNEFCQGHQCWRGRTTWGITSTGTRKPPEAQLIEGKAAPHAGHVGIKTPGGVRNDLTREFPKPRFYHFATDIAGRRLISDAPQSRIYLAELGEPGKDPLRNFKYLLSAKSSGKKQAHVHPFLSPDGSLGFFNSDESGILQAYMIRGLERA